MSLQDIELLPVNKPCQKSGKISFVGDDGYRFKESL